MSHSSSRGSWVEEAPLPVGPPPEQLRYVVPRRACCCPARPMVTVVVPATRSRLHSVDLHLCRHHYLAAHEALAAVGVSVSFIDDP